MDVQKYLRYLLNFYTYMASKPWTKLELQDHVYPARVRLNFQQDFVLMDYNLGFKVGKLCYVFQKLAIKNMKKIEAILTSKRAEQLFINVHFKKNKCIICCYDIYGKSVYTTKIKFTSLNWF